MQGAQDVEVRFDGFECLRYVYIRGHIDEMGNEGADVWAGCGHLRSPLRLKYPAEHSLPSTANSQLAIPLRVEDVSAKACFGAHRAAPPANEALYDPPMWNVVGVLPVSPAPQGHLTADVPVEMMSVPGNARLDALVMSPTRMFWRALLRGLLAVWCTAAPSAGLWGGKATVHCATGRHQRQQHAAAPDSGSCWWGF